jgi:hypothetical protein
LAPIGIAAKHAQKPIEKEMRWLNSIRMAIRAKKWHPLACPEPGLLAAGIPVQLRTGCAHVHRSSVKFDSVYGYDCPCRIGIVRHLQKGEASGLPGQPIRHDPEPLNRPILFENASNVLLGGVQTQISYENIIHPSSLANAIRDGR